MTNLISNSLKFSYAEADVLITVHVLYTAKHNDAKSEDVDLSPLFGSKSVGKNFKSL